MPLPPPLTKPGPLGLIAPGSAPRDPSALREGIAAMKRRGYDVDEAGLAGPAVGYLSATDEVRLEALNRSLRRTDIGTLVSVRGGYGVLRLLDGVDYEAARTHPKLLVGYSDVTALQLALFRHAGWRSLSGPMAAVEWADPHEASIRAFEGLAAGDIPAPLRNPDGSDLRAVRSGCAVGTLLGGNLSMVVRLLGTRHLPDLSGAILFLEDVGEEPYRLDALFAQLRLAGILARLGGVVLGAFTDAEIPAGKPSQTVEDVLHHYFGSAPFPVARGLAYGHFSEKATVPIGVRARLDVSDASAELHVLEPVVRTD